MTRFALSLGVLFLGAAPHAVAQDRPTSVAEQYLFDAANQERAQRGIPALRWDESLYRAAQVHARQMAQAQAISHQFSGEDALELRASTAGARFSVVAENVAMAPSVTMVHTAWMRSPGHRDNLLDPRVDSVGISVIRRGNEMYAVQDFDRAVRPLSLAEQERQVAGLVARAGVPEVRTSGEAARQTCGMDSGYAGDRAPSFVVRFTAADLSRLPDTLSRRLASGQYRAAEVGACAAEDARNFTAFQIAVLLYL